MLGRGRATFARVQSLAWPDPHACTSRFLAGRPYENLTWFSQSRRGEGRVCWGACGHRSVRDRQGWRL